MGYSNEDWRRIDRAVEANRSLRSLGISDSSGTPPPTSFIDHLCMNETLENINCNIWAISENIFYSGESTAGHSMCICFSFSFKIVIIIHRHTRQLSEVPVSST